MLLKPIKSGEFTDGGDFKLAIYVYEDDRDPEIGIYDPVSSTSNGGTVRRGSTIRITKELKGWLLNHLGIHPKIFEVTDLLLKAAQAQQIFWEMLGEMPGGKRPKPDDSRYTLFIGEWNTYEAPEVRFENFAMERKRLRLAALEAATDPWLAYRQSGCTCQVEDAAGFPTIVIYNPECPIIDHARQGMTNDNTE